MAGINHAREYAREGDKEMRALNSIEKAAGLLGVSKWTVRSYIRAGKLKPVRLGRRVLLTDDELERFVAEGLKSQVEVTQVVAQERNAQ